MAITARKRLSTWTLSSNGFLCAVVILLSLLALSYSVHRSFDHDEFEHIHSSWYVANGYTPYTDFFQNHHPLLWYCLGPLLLILGYSTQTVILLRLVMYGLTMGMAFLTFLIARRVTASTTASLLSVVLLLSMVMFLEKSIEIRPDVPQVLLGLVSVYFFVSFIQTQKNRHMVLAGVCASFSFLFLQKTIFLLIAYALILCYSLLRRRTPFTSAVYLVVSFSLPTLLFLAYLLLSESLQDYLLTNWLVNTRWIETFSPLRDLSRSFVAQSALLCFFSATVATLVLLHQKRSRAFRAAAFAVVVLLLSVVLLLTYSVSTGSFADYVVTNWVVNTRWLETFSPRQYLSRSFATQNALFWSLSAASVAFILLRKKSDHALKATAFIGTVLLFSVFLVKVPFRQYYMFAIPPLCITSGYFLERVVDRTRLHGIYLGLLVILLLLQPLSFLARHKVRPGLREQQLAKVDFVIHNSTESDLVYDGNIQFNLFRPDLHYFWYSVGEYKGLDSYNAVTNSKYGDYDVCQLVRSRQPKFISNYELSLVECGLRPFYERTPFSGLYVRSDKRDGQRLLWRNLGDSVALIGYELDPIAGQEEGLLHLTLWWQSLARMDTDYTLFIHVVGSGDRIYAQQDSLLLSGRRPTSAWRASETVKQQCDLTLPPGTPSSYTIRVGLYYWETGERLPVWDESGQRVANDAILLPPEAAEY